ncbi:MAG: Nramp family divalent metal transporter [Micrococcaceae bacterium]
MAETKPIPKRTLVALLGPAFVAAIAYVDPGNVAANLTAGGKYGYLLVWVLVVSNIMAVIVQYLSAKLGIVRGQSLPEVLGQKMTRRWRLAYWLQAEVVAISTDLAEIIGGAIAFKLLFDIPLFWGGVITGVLSMIILAVKERYGQRIFEFVIVGFLFILTVGFCIGLFITPPDTRQILTGLEPRFEGTETVLLAVSMLGATVMPHAVYLHSALTRDRFPMSGDGSIGRAKRLLSATRVDVVIALVVAGSVNIGMLLLAAVNLQGADGTDTIDGAYYAIKGALGVQIAFLFAIGLLASGLASTSVGCYAGAEVMETLLKVKIPLLVRRLITLIPALVLLATGISPTLLLVISQVVLSFGIPFALVPLVMLTSDKTLLGKFANKWYLSVIAWLVASLITLLNIVLLYLLFAGQG